MEELDSQRTEPDETRAQRANRSLISRLLVGTGILAGVGVLAGVGILAFYRYTGGEVFSFSSPYTYSVALGDLDGDGDLDAFYANGESEGPRPNTVLINQGGAQGGLAGDFQDSGQRLGNESSREVTLADLDRDGDLDAWVANIGYHTLFFNQGDGTFSASTTQLFADHIGDSLGGTGEWAVALGDLDGDGDLDAMTAGCCGAVESSPGVQRAHPPFNLVWFNQGGSQAGRLASFLDSGIPLESLGAKDVALGDLDRDGDLDAFFGDFGVLDRNADFGAMQPNTVWWNDGHGGFVDSGQRLGQAGSLGVALGDLDGDGDLDAYIVNRSATRPFGAPDEVWINMGGDQGGRPGRFQDSGQRLGNAYSTRVVLADMNLDGSLDAAVTVHSGISLQPHLEIWLNNGQGVFRDSGQRLSQSGRQAFALGDLNGDGAPDVYAACYETCYTDWINSGDGYFGP
jgi:hypothetical protein